MQDRLARQLNFIAFFADAFDEYLLTFLQFIAHVADAAISDFGNMKQTISAGKDLDESPEVDDAANRADVCLADFGFRG